MLLACDETDWCRDNIKVPGARVVANADYYASHAKSLRPVISEAHFDFLTTAFTDHVMFDYGSFGFWFSFLNKGHVFYPHKLKVSAPAIGGERGSCTLYTNIDQGVKTSINLPTPRVLVKRHKNAMKSAFCGVSGQNLRSPKSKPSPINGATPK